MDHIPPGEELRMCLLVKTSLGRIRRWRQDQCQVHNLLYPRDDMKMCFLMKIALGRIRRWRQDQCQVQNF